MKQAFLYSINFSRATTFSTKLILQKRYLLRKAFLFQKSWLFESVNFSEKQYSRTYFFRRGNLTQLHFLSTVTISIYKLIHLTLVSNVQWQCGSSFFFLAQTSHHRHSLFDYLTRRIHKVLWNSYFLSKLSFQSFYYFRTATFSKRLVFRQSHCFARCYFRTSIISQLASFSQLSFLFIS